MQVQVFLQAGIPPGEVAELGELAHACGIQTLWASSFPAAREPFMCLSGLAARRTGLRLGVVPVSPYEQHPLKIADSLLTLHELSGGHGTITIGGMGHSVMRVTALEPVHRVTAVRECVEILQAATSGEPVDYQGEVYTLTNYQAGWAADLPPPPIYVGANGPAMLKMAGEVADGIMLSDMPLSRMGEVLAQIDTGRAGAGRDGPSLKIANFFAWHIKEDRQEAMDEARMELIWRGLLLPSHTSPFLGDEDAAFVDANRDAFLQAFLTRNPKIEGVPEELVDTLVDNLTFTGGPGDIDRVLDHLRDFAAAGLDEVTLKIHGDAREAIRLIGARLIPALG
ncbi:MAG: LLM class flavin-dependent oxidoreductase [Gammaproteobacteria bacterium]|jgi:5,10-methylenetetrahydromethanopterin reductase|nr:LLM class flavin-dependent oxidoreductase [Gammaproteobacteria bacterium]MDP6617715.1 LLM class flavin-dependent oxidoreductase [Gammaproteobacteria bacterium]MDP6695676.1 LLM class flavin-dependent oxidoreductase [Gammaproteobacteria bacterium]